MMGAIFSNQNSDDKMINYDECLKAAIREHSVHHMKIYDSKSTMKKHEKLELSMEVDFLEGYKFYDGSTIETAAFYGSFKIVNYIISNQIHLPYNMKWGFIYAEKGGQLEMVEYFQSLKYMEQWYSAGLERACDTDSKEHRAVVKYIFSLGVSQYALNLALKRATEANNIDTAKILVENGADNFKYCLNDSCRMGHPQMVKFFLQLGVKPTESDLQTAKETTYHYRENDKEEIIKMLQ